MLSIYEVKPLRSARKQDRIRFERTEKFFLPLRQSDDGNPPEEVELTEDLDRASELSLTAESAPSPKGRWQLVLQ